MPLSNSNDVIPSQTPSSGNPPSTRKLSHGSFNPSNLGVDQEKDHLDTRPVCKPISLPPPIWQPPLQSEQRNSFSPSTRRTPGGSSSLKKQRYPAAYSPDTVERLFRSSINKSNGNNESSSNRSANRRPLPRLSLNSSSQQKSSSPQTKNAPNTSSGPQTNTTTTQRSTPALCRSPVSSLLGHRQQNIPQRSRSASDRGLRTSSDKNASSFSSSFSTPDLESEDSQASLHYYLENSSNPDIIFCSIPPNQQSNHSMTQPKTSKSCGIRFLRYFRLLSPRPREHPIQKEVRHLLWWTILLDLVVALVAICSYGDGASARITCCGDGSQSFPYQSWTRP